MKKTIKSRNSKKPKASNKSSRTLKLKGHGDYTIQKQPGILTQVGDIGTDLLGMLGDSYLPGSSKLIKPLSKAALSAFSKLTGFGDYEVHQNSIIGQPNTEHPPAVFGHGAERIKDSEFVQFLTFPGVSSFTQIASFLVNPANQVLFPKLSQKAKLFQQYYLHGCVLRLESVCSESVTLSNNAMSIPTLITTSNYNLNMPKPSSDKMAMNQFFTSTSRVNKDQVHPIECDPALQPMKCLYIWDHTTSSKDQNLYNSCQVFLFTTGGIPVTPTPVPYQIYKLYVDYDVELIKPTINYKEEYVYDIWNGTTPVTGFALGTAPSLDSSSTSAGRPQTLYKFDGHTITFDPSYTGLCDIGLYATYSVGALCSAGFVPDGVNVVTHKAYLGDSADHITNNGETSYNWYAIQSVQVTGGGSITLDDISGTSFNKSSMVVELYSE